ncbi:universal stress protein [Streptomyces sp. TLI_146]|uniref:universal stress protein n=1 Tax=Streptomyces sp. TLI_146 TaxID=1938858 RepID=UPI000C705B2F|nr:universal stress protein [Streptomyces sp. TLI_146]PKV83156.1 nucleotide-binding universal stress UspA family protein [Streptomyces sp. TLI_146]
MARSVIAGIDGSSESRAAAVWAAGEAERRGLALTLVHAWQAWQPVVGYAPLGAAAVLWEGPDGPDGEERRARRMLDEVFEQLRDHCPGVEITAELIPGQAVDVLLAAAAEGEVLVLGSRAPSALTGFLTGSVSMAVLARAARPVVLVRPKRPDDAVEPAGAEEGSGDVVLGLDFSHPCDTLIDYAVEAAAARGAALRVVHTWTPPPVFGYDPAAVDPRHIVDLGAAEAHALDDVLEPWRAKFPSVGIETRCVADRPAERLVEAAEDAALLVVGRRIRSGITHIGPVTHGVLHHARTPVAVVAHR